MTLRIEPKVIEELRELVAENRLIPFVGAGVSQPLGLPSWEGLIDDIASELRWDPDVFRAEGDYPQLADYYLLEKRHIGRLRSRLDRRFNDDSIDIASSRTHELLVKLNAPVVYTTNFDNLLERAHEEQGQRYQSIVTIEDFEQLTPGVVQIVKLHGSLERDETLVLAETHYFERLALDSALDIKLRADMLGRSVLFMGYSLQDINVRYLLFRLAGLWRAGGSGSNPQFSYFVDSCVGSVQRAILRKRYTTETIELAPGHETEGLEQLLAAIGPESS